MALYLGDSEVLINLDGAIYKAEQLLGQIADTTSTTEEYVGNNTATAVVTE